MSVRMIAVIHGFSAGIGFPFFYPFSYYYISSHFVPSSLWLVKDAVHAYPGDRAKNLICSFQNTGFRGIWGGIQRAHDFGMVMCLSFSTIDKR